MGGDSSSAEKKDRPTGPSDTAMSTQVVMRYHATSAKAGIALKNILKNQEGVTDVKLDTETRSARYGYSGTWRGLRSTERASSVPGMTANIVSHAYVLLSVEPGAGYDAKAFKTSLQAVPGVQFVCLCTDGRSVLDLYADLSVLRFGALHTAAEENHAKISVRTHQEVEISAPEGTRDALCTTLSQNASVLSARVEEDKIIVTTVGKLSDRTFADAAKRAGADITMVRKS